MPALTLLTAPAGAQPRLRSELLSALLKQGYAVERRMETANWDDLFEEALTPSLFSSQRIFEIDDGKSLGPLPEHLVKFIEPASHDGSVAEVQIILHSEKTLQKELGDAYRLATVISHTPAPTWPSQRTSWLQRLAREQSIRLDAEAASMLVEWVQEEEELRSELTKLGAVAGKKPVTAALVRELSIDDGQRGMLNLLDAVARCDYVGVLQNLLILRENGELVPVLSALHRRFRGAMFVALFGEKAGSVLKLTEYQLKSARAMSKLYGRRMLVSALGEIIRLSWSERNGEGEGWDGLERLLLMVISRSAR